MEEDLASRMEKILPGGKGVWVPMDHAASSFPEQGLLDFDKVVDTVIDSGVDAIVLHKGAVSHHSSRISWDRFVCHSSVSTVHGGARSQDKVLVCTASEALNRGAIGISAQVNLGDTSEPEMIQRMSKISREAFEEGLPVMGMFYPRGGNLSIDPSDSTGGIAHSARLAWELGCNVVKVPWTGSRSSFEIVTSSVPIPVLVSGGPRDGDFFQILEIVENSMKAGASGVCIGRHVFGAKDPASHIQSLRAIVHNSETAEEAARFLR